AVSVRRGLEHHHVSHVVVAIGAGLVSHGVTDSGVLHQLGLLGGVGIAGPGEHVLDDPAIGGVAAGLIADDQIVLGVGVGLDAAGVVARSAVLPAIVTAFHHTGLEAVVQIVADQSLNLVIDALSAALDGLQGVTVIGGRVAGDVSSILV